jgi:hypothetical protein
MTRIETIFGGVLAVAVLSVFAFVFFGQAPTEAAETSDTPRRSSFTKTSVAELLDEESEDYEVPSTACGCYGLGYDMVRSGKVEVTSYIFEGQSQACYDSVGQMGAEALSDGAMAAVEGERKSCRPSAYLVK